MTVKRQSLYVLTFLVSCYLIHGTAIAGPVFFDDFADRDIYDNEPVSWAGGGGDNFSIDDEDTFGLVVDSENLVRAAVQGLDLADISVRARVSLTEGGMVGIASRWKPGASSYYGVFAPASGIVRIGRAGVFDFLDDGFVRDVGPTDVMLQLDVIDDQINFWVWAPGELMRDEPTVSAQHGDLTSGDFYIWGGGSFDFNPKGPVEVAIRYVEVADQHILTGDFNRDGSLDINDVDALVAAVRSNDNSLKHDVNNDEVIDEEDHRFWVKRLKRTWFGDANLDGEFNSGDLVELFAAAEYEDDIPMNSNWATGDFNGDAEFDSGDLVAAFADTGYEKGPRAAVNVVPEPASLLMLTVGLVGVTICRRHVRV